MRRVLIFAVVLTLILSTTEQSSAQSYRLRTPSATEYLAALPDLVTQARFEDTSEYQADSRLFQDISLNELRTNYSDLQNVSFDTLYNAAAAIPLNSYSEGTYSDYGWHHALLDAWLRENDVDLSTQTKWQFRGYNLKLTPIDFSGDGVPELVADLTFQPSDYPDYQELFVMQRDDTTAGKYRQVRLPSPFWYSASCAYNAGCGGGVQTFEIADLNGDGLSEWAIATHSCGYGECGGRLTILGWRQDEMVDLVREEWPNALFWTTASGGGGGPALPPDGTWTFSTSVSGEYQIVQRRNFYDNRNCEVTYTTIFTWDEAKDRFVPKDRVTVYANSGPCALRVGQLAMSEGQYQWAAKEYTRAIDLLPDSGEAYAVEAVQYAQIRVVLAYALAGQTDKALQIRNKLIAQTPVSETMGHLLDALHTYNGRQDAIRLCAQMRQAVSRFNPYSDDGNTQLLIFGQTDDVQNRSSMYTGGGFSPDSAGCGLETALTPPMEHIPVIPNQPPSAYIASLGLHVSQAFGADLNGDGESDWLIWLHDISDMQALSFVSAGKYYHFSMHRFALPSKNVQWTVMQLPDETAPMLVSLGVGAIDVWNGEYTHPCDENPPYGSLDLVQVKADSLQRIGSYLLCEPRTLTQIFLSSTQIRAWRPAYYDVTAAEVIFQWNAAEKTYSLLTGQSETAPRCSNQPYEYCGFDLNNPQALGLLNATLATPPQDASTGFLMAARYSRGLLLQKQGNPTDALADFVAVYEHAPSAAWKNLAALHLVPIDS